MGKNIRHAVAKDVRAFFAENPNLIPEGAEVSVRQGSRGRIAPAAVKVFNKHNRSRPYAEGNRPLIVIPVPAQDSMGRNITKKVNVPVSEARKLAGDHAGKRGFLSEQALSVAGERYAKKVLAGAK